MDEWLDEQGLYRKNTALDGTCLFRATAEQLMPTNPLTGHLILRKRVVKFIQNNRDHFESRLTVPFDEYIEYIAKPTSWAGALELEAISLLYSVDFEVFHGPDPPLRVTNHGFEKVLMLCVTSRRFYDAVYQKSTIQTFGFCQSIIYKLLYGEVFKLDDLDYAVDKMLHDKAARAQRERYLSKQSISRDEHAYDSYLEDAETPVNVRKILDTGAILFPYKVAKALDPDIFRNIDFDNWVETQRGKLNYGDCICNVPVTRRSNFWYGNGGPLRVGVKCNVRIDDRVLTCHIQEMSAEMGPALVFVEELSQKLTVPYEHLIPMPRSSLKPEWSYSHKHQMISRLGKDATESTKRRFRTKRSKDDSSSSSINEADSSCIKDHEVHCNNEDRSAVVIAEADSTTSESSLSTPSRCLVITPSDERNVVDTSARISSRPDYSDLPMDDLETLRFFYNMGVQYFRQGTITYGGPIQHVVSSNNTEPPVCGSPIVQTNIGQGSPLGHAISLHSPTYIPSYQVPAPSMVPVTTYPPPLPPVPPVTTQTPIIEQLSQQNKERGRKFNKPPRFQRLEGTEARTPPAVTGGQHAPETEDVQLPDISSTTPQEQPLCHYPVHPPPPITYPLTYPSFVPFVCQHSGEQPISSVTYSDQNMVTPMVDTGMYQTQYPMYPLPIYYQ